MAIGGLLLFSGLTDTEVPGLVLMVVGAFFGLMAAAAYGPGMAQRKVQRTLTTSEAVSLLRYLTPVGDPEERRLRPIAGGLGLPVADARLVVEDAGLVAEEGASGRYGATDAGVRRPEEHGT